jgi:hypothetical protein
MYLSILYRHDWLFILFRKKDLISPNFVSSCGDIQYKKTAKERQLADRREGGGGGGGGGANSYNGEKACTSINLFVYFFGGLLCVGHSFAYVAHFVFFRDVWIRASRRATNLATHLPDLATHLPDLATHLLT